MDFNDMIKVDFDCSTCNKLKRENQRIPVKRVIERLDDCFKTNDLDSARGLLEYWAEEAKNVNDLSGELSVVNEMLGLYRKTQEKEKGKKAVVRAIELLGATKNDRTLSGATIMINAATTSNAFGNPEKAVPLYEKAIEIYEENRVPKDDLMYGALYNNYATTLVDIKEFEKAKELYEKAIEITGREIKSLLDCAVSYVNLAHLYEGWQGGLSEEIGRCLEKAEEILNDKRIERNSYYAFVSEKCAPSFDYFGYFAFAEELTDKARKIYEGA